MPHIPGHIDDPLAIPEEQPTEELSYGDMLYDYLFRISIGSLSYLPPLFYFDESTEEKVKSGSLKHPSKTKPWKNLDKMIEVDSNLPESVLKTIHPNIEFLSGLEDEYGDPVIGLGSFWDQAGDFIGRKDILEGEDYEIKKNIVLEDFSITPGEQHIADVANTLIGTDTYRIESGYYRPAQERRNWQMGFGITGQADIAAAEELWGSTEVKGERGGDIRTNMTCADAACDIYEEAGIPWPKHKGIRISDIDTVIDVLDGKKFQDENAYLSEHWERMDSIKDIRIGSLVFVGRAGNPGHTTVVTRITDDGIEVVNDGGHHKAKYSRFYLWDDLTDPSLSFKSLPRKFVVGYNWTGRREGEPSGGGGGGAG
jgi:hypothetical protein